MRTIPEVVEDIKSILNNIERRENCDGKTLVDINEVADEILTISTYKGKKQTNADRIRSMSDEELEEFLVDVETYGYHDQSISGTLEILDWLKSEVEE